MDHRPLTLPPDLLALHETIDRGGRIATDDACTLLTHPDILAVAAMADAVTRRKWGDQAFYSAPTRVSLLSACSATCAICAPLPTDLASRLAEQVGASAAEIHLVGLPAQLRLDALTSLIRSLRDRLPSAWIQGFGAPDLNTLALREACGAGDVATALQRAGLDGLLGLHEEVCTQHGRRLLPDDLDPSPTALSAVEQAHAAGLTSIATLTYRPGDDATSIVARLDALRERQRASGGFSVFTALPIDLEAGTQDRETPSGYEDLRIISVARLFLDNIPHIRAPWLALGLKMGQVALSFGADDLGWAPLDPHARAYSPSTSFISLDEGELVRLTAAARRRASRVDGAYRALAAV